MNILSSENTKQMGHERNRKERRANQSKLKHGLHMRQRQLFNRLREKARNLSCERHGNPGTIWWRVPPSIGHKGFMQLLCNECTPERAPDDEMIRVFP